jgi:fluoroquinolone transport system permease protein
MTAPVFRALLYADSRSLWRDPLLGWVLALPLGVALLLKLVIRTVNDAGSQATSVALEAYYPLIMGGYLMTAPAIAGMVIGFLLLDERDARTLSALRVTPLSMRLYLPYRIVLPIVIGTASTLVSYPLVGVVRLPFVTLAVMAGLAAFYAPLIALLLAVAAPNKVAGFAVVKALSALNLLPLAAFFVDPPVQFLAGVFPGYWPMRALWSAASGGSYLHHVAIGLVVCATAIGFCVWLFDRKLLRHA